MENAIQNQKSYSSKREYAFDLFTEGWNREDVAELLEITYNTSKTYYQLWKKEQGLVKERVSQKTEAQEPQEAQCDKNNKFEKLETEFMIGNGNYTIDYYRDLEDDTLWFNFMKIVEAIRAEEICDISEKNIDIPSRYLRNEFFESKLINMIDKNALLDFAKAIGDFTLMSSVMDFMTENVDYFYKFFSIVKSFELMENYLNGIEDRYSEIKAFNDCQNDILHEFDNSRHKLTAEDKVKVYDRINNLRLARRATKNELVLSQTLRGLFKYHNANARNINFMSTKLKEILMALYNKSYNPRVDKLDDMQKELIEKVINNQ